MMNTAVKHEPYCYDLRGKDTETHLVGPITSQIIDADRLVRADFRNGMPNWMLYRTALAGDSIYLPRLREWVTAFTLTYCLNGAVKRKTINDELVGAVALDALSRLVFGRWLDQPSAMAECIGMDRNTYKRLRDRIYSRMAVSLDEYWIRLILAYRMVKNYERSEHRPIRRYNQP